MIDETSLYFFKLMLSSKFPQNIFIIWKELIRRMHSNELHLGVQFDLTIPFEIPEPQIPLSIREIQENDIPEILNLKEKDIDSIELRKRLISRLFIKADIPTCYVGLTNDEFPCVICWLIDVKANDKVQSFLKKAIPNLKPGEVLCENILTNSVYRGKRLMRYMTLKLFEKAIQDGAHRAIAFIAENNILSWRASERIGWKPFLVKKVQWRIFRRYITYINYNPN